ncbi:MAG: EamA family transporter [Hylemonella sp.]|uniref:EamA family transporter n=1 Tax=Hylemonella sp. TaxID=2066020 RepID=UPI0022BBEAA7|nr:EamA family transporter [Hylemonella sp.]MCZ8252119.1 EamA family transporter [Hylemonella sp.]
MPLTHLLLALAVVAVWGSNFVVIKFGLTELPPLLLATMRFALSALPWLFFIRRPAVAWRYLVGYGVLMGFMFGLLFLSMRSDVTPGLASLLMQSQVFMTLLLVAWLQHERMPRIQFAGLSLATTGFALIAWAGFTQAHDVTPLGLGLALSGAFCWACANVVSRSIGKVDMLGFMVWSSIFAVPPLLVLSLSFEGVAAITEALPRASLAAWAAMLWQALGNTLFGFGAWGWLLARHPAATITPLALLIPVFGMGSSALILGEPLQAWKLGAAALVMAGLAVSVLGARWRAR